jgi:hypothetical protein
MTVGNVVTEWRPHRLKTPDAKIYTLPPFQRAWSPAWTPERCCAYLNGVLRGEPQTPIVVWAPDEQRRMLHLLDGQHRLCSLGATVLDTEGNRRPRPEVCFDLVRAEWVPGKANGVTTFDHDRLMRYEDGRRPADLADGRAPGRWYSDAFWDALLTVHGAMSDADLKVTTLRIGESPEGWRRALSFFVRLNESIPFTESELTALRAFVATLEDSCLIP